MSCKNFDGTENRMKTRYREIWVTLGLVVLIWSSSAQAQTKSELDTRVRKLRAQFEALQSDPQARIPADKLQQAKGVIVMDRTKGGFIFGYEKGSGIAMVKSNGNWSAFSFMSSHEGSFGAQIGGKTSFAVILLMNEAARDRLINPKVDFGGEAGGTGGSSQDGVGESFTDQPPVIVYGTSKGLYGGATLKGGSVAADDKDNEKYYGQYYSSKEILFDKKVEPSETAVEFAKTLEAAAKTE